MSDRLETALTFIPTTSPEMEAAARRTVAASSRDASEAKLMLQMLGLMDGEAGVAHVREVGHCTCGAPMVSWRTPLPLPAGTKRHRGRGLCTSCHKRARRAERKATS